MTLAIPVELKSKMEEFPEMNWSEIARQAFAQKIKDMEFLREFKKNSSMTKVDALKLGSELNKKLSKKYKA